MKKKWIAICLIIALLASCLFFQNHLLRTYVSLCHEDLEHYAVQLLDSSVSETDHYGIWKTWSHPEAGMVEFLTGGWGLAPSSTYQRFYYSADDTHQIFSAAGDSVSMEIEGDRASWTDGTDNHGTSIRITEKWFWFEASF